PLALALGCTIDILLPRARLASVWTVLGRHRSAVAYYATVLALVAGVLAGVGAYAAVRRKAERGLFIAAGAGRGPIAVARGAPPGRAAPPPRRASPGARPSSVRPIVALGRAARRIAACPPVRSRGGRGRRDGRSRGAQADRAGSGLRAGGV